MTQRSEFRFAGLLALSAVLAAPSIHAQSTAPMTDPAQTPASQPASPSPQAEAAPARKTWADLDIDKNGNLDKAEAGGAPSLQAVFDQADANADGSLTIYIQKESPGQDKQANWLPAPKGTFILMMRNYWPNSTSPTILDGSWKIPPVKAVE